MIARAISHIKAATRQSVRDRANPSIKHSEAMVDFEDHHHEQAKQNARSSLARRGFTKQKTAKGLERSESAIDAIKAQAAWLFGREESADSVYLDENSAINGIDEDTDADGGAVGQEASTPKPKPSMVGRLWKPLLLTLLMAMAYLYQKGKAAAKAAAEAEAARKKGSSLPVMAAILLVFALIGLWLRSQSSGSGKAEGKRWQRKNTADGKRLKRANTKY